MFGIIISVIVLLTMGYLILKNYKPQVVLAAAGIFLMICGVWLGYGALVAPEKSSGYLLLIFITKFCACSPVAPQAWGCRLWPSVAMPAIWTGWEPVGRW